MCIGGLNFCINGSNPIYTASLMWIFLLVDRKSDFDSLNCKQQLYSVIDTLSEQSINNKTL